MHTTKSVATNQATQHTEPAQPLPFITLSPSSLLSNKQLWRLQTRESKSLTTQEVPSLAPCRRCLSPLSRRRNLRQLICTRWTKKRSRRFKWKVGRHKLFFPYPPCLLHLISQIPLCRPLLVLFHHRSPRSNIYQWSRLLIQGHKVGSSRFTQDMSLSWNAWHFVARGWSVEEWIGPWPWRAWWFATQAQINQSSLWSFWCMY